MKLIKARILSNNLILKGRDIHNRKSRNLAKSSNICNGWIMWLRCPEITNEAKPGQFVMVRCGEERLLLRPFSIHQINKHGDMAIFYEVQENGRGTQWLSQCQKDDSLDLLGPLGNGFSIKPGAKNLLLVAGGIGIAPLYFLAQDILHKGYNTTLIYGTKSNQRYDCQNSLPSGINIISVTEDGSIGYKGRVTDIIKEHINWADQIFACGPIMMYRNMELSEYKLKHEKGYIQVSLEIRMGCGIGACYSCTIMTKDGLKQVCKDGPIFNLGNIIWDELNYESSVMQGE